MHSWFSYLDGTLPLATPMPHAQTRVESETNEVPVAGFSELLVRRQATYSPFKLDGLRTF